MQGHKLFNNLYELEATPPPNMWLRIAEKLDEEEQDLKKTTPVISIVDKSKNNWSKIAIAASLVGFMIMTGMWINEKSKNNNEINLAKNTNSISTNPIQKNDEPSSTSINEKLNKIENLNNNSQVENIGKVSEVAINKSEINSTITKSNSVIQKIRNNNSTSSNDFSNKNLVSRNIGNAENKKVNSESKANKNEQSELINISNENVNSNIEIAKVKQPELIIKDNDNTPVRNIEVIKSQNAGSVTGPDNKGDKTIGNILSKISLINDNEEIDVIIENSNYWKSQIQNMKNILLKKGYNSSQINNLDSDELKKLINEKK